MKLPGESAKLAATGDAFNITVVQLLEEIVGAEKFSTTFDKNYKELFEKYTKEESNENTRKR